MLGPYRKIDSQAVFTREEVKERDEPTSPNQSILMSEDVNTVSSTSSSSSLGGHLKHWLFELLAAWFSLVCIIVIVLVLRYEDGQPLNGWRLMIPPNALISFFATISKSSFLLVLMEVIAQLKWIHFSNGTPQKLYDIELFDRASRGPLGATMLMLRRHRSIILASVGSFFVLAALFVDPFAQLIFSFPLRQVTSTTSRAQTPASPSYDSGASMLVGLGDTVIDFPLDFDVATYSAAYGKEQDFSISCPTSNCTWAPLWTIGLCSTCQDVSSSTETSCNTHNQTDADGWVESSVTVCNSTFPSGRWLTMSLFEATDEWEKSLLNATAAAVDLYVQDGLINTDAQIADPAAFASYGTLASISVAQGTSALMSQDLSAVFTECSVSLCAKRYEDLAVLEGRTVSPSIHEYPLRVISEGYDFLGDEAAQDKCWPNCPSSPPTPFVLQALVHDSTPGARNFTLDFAAVYGLRSYIPDLFSQGFEYQIPANVSVKPPNAGDGGLDAPDIGHAMFDARPLEPWVKSIAASITETMRATSRNRTTFYGDALIMENYIHISWAWLALPVILSVSSLILLIVVIVKTHNMGISVWKTASLPLLFHHLEGWPDSSDHFDNIKDLKRRAERMTGTLSEDPRRRAFVRAAD